MRSWRWVGVFAALGPASACGGKVGDSGLRDDDVADRWNDRADAGSVAAGGGSTVPPGVAPPGTNPTSPPGTAPPGTVVPPPPTGPVYPPPPGMCEPVWLGAATGFGVSSGFLTSGPGIVSGNCGGMGAELALDWYAPFSGEFVIDTVGSEFDTVLSLRSGGCTGSELNCNDDFDGVASRVELFVQQGQEVTIVVDTFGDSSGYYVLNVSGPSEGVASCSEIVDLGNMMGLPVFSDVLPPGAGYPNDCGGIGAAMVFRWTPPWSGYFAVSTIGSAFDTVLDVRNECGGMVIECNDDTVGTESALNVWGDGGVPLYFTVHQYQGSGDGSGGVPYQLNIEESGIDLL